jgi:hypothetical protein
MGVLEDFMSAVIHPYAFNPKRTGLFSISSAYRISTRTLALVDNVFKIVAGCAAYYFNPAETLKGALAGAAVRLIMQQDMAPPDENSARAYRIAYICMTVIALVCVVAIPGSHPFVSLLLGFSAAGDGAYELLSKWIDGTSLS